MMIQTDECPPHVWHNAGFDNIHWTRLTDPKLRHDDANIAADGAVLCATRYCYWCGRVEAKPYGHGGRKPWRRVKR